MKRRTGDHLMSQAPIPRCVTCGCDEDDAFVAGEKCSYVALTKAKERKDFVQALKSLASEMTGIKFKVYLTKDNVPLFFKDTADTKRKKT